MTKWVPPSLSEREEMMRADEAVRIAREREAKRTAQRISLHARVSATSEDNFFAGMSENISEGGVFVASYSPPAVGETVTLDVEIGSGTRLRVSGVVRWLRYDHDGNETGCGVEFEGLSAEDRRKVARLVQELRREPLLAGF